MTRNYMSLTVPVLTYHPPHIENERRVLLWQERRERETGQPPAHTSRGRQCVQGRR